MNANEPADPDASGSDFSAPPAFKPDEALVQLKRQLRELRGLVERGSGFELNARAVLQLKVIDDGTGGGQPRGIEARIARRAVARPEWDIVAIRSGADLRKLVDTVKARLTRWSDDD